MLRPPEVQTRVGCSREFARENKSVPTGAFFPKLDGRRTYNGLMYPLKQNDAAQALRLQRVSLLRCSIV